MKKLTKKEEEIMNLFWDKGAMFVKELLELYAEPKPHFNTLSTMARTLEANGYVAHKAYGNSYQYYPVVTREEYAGSTFKGGTGEGLPRLVGYIQPGAHPIRQMLSVDIGVL